jgi:hypothetical protein
MQAKLPRGPRRRAEDARECRRLREQLCEPAAHRGIAGSAGGTGAPGAAPGAAPISEWASRHLASCPDCAAFARRLEQVRRALARPLSEPAIEPGPHFPARVLARIARPAELMGWAAFRALPAALGLALALAWLGLAAPASPPPAPAPSPLLDEPPSSEQLLAWSSLSPEVWP